MESGKCLLTLHPNVTKETIRKDETDKCGIKYAVDDRAGFVYRAEYVPNTDEHEQNNF